MNKELESFLVLLKEAKDKEKKLTEFIINLYTDIKNRNPVRLRSLVFVIENLGEEIPNSDLNKYIKLFKMKYDE